MRSRPSPSPPLHLQAQATETGKTDPLSTVAAGGSGGDPPGPGKATRQGGPQDDWNLLSEASKLIMALGLLGTVLIIIRSELEKDRKRKRDAKEKKRKELEQASAIDGSVKKGGPPGDT